MTPLTWLRLQSTDTVESTLRFTNQRREETHHISVGPSANVQRVSSRKIAKSGQVPLRNLPRFCC